MIKHFHLIYFNSVKWAETAKMHNTTIVADKLIQSIFVLWIVAIGFLTDIYFLHGFIEKYWWIWLGAAAAIYLIIKFIIGANIKNRCLDLEEKYRRIYNWKKSGYRKRALFYVFLHFFIFPTLIVYSIKLWI